MNALHAPWTATHSTLADGFDVWTIRDAAGNWVADAPFYGWVPVVGSPSNGIEGAAARAKLIAAAPVMLDALREAEAGLELTDAAAKPPTDFVPSPTLALRAVRAALAIACAALTACGGGGIDTPQPAAAHQATLQLFGDSTLHLMAPLIVARYGAGRVEDRSKGGSSSTQLLAGTDGINLAWPQSVTADYILINHGLNDGFTVKRVSLEQFRGNLERLIAAPGTTPILQTPLPSTTPLRDMAGYAEVTRQVAAAHGLQLVDMFACFQEQPGWRDRLPDGTHPDAQGVQAMAECAEPVLDAVMSEGVRP